MLTKPSSGTRSHEVLLVDELLISILVVLLGRNLKATLANVARTCKACYEPATELLWLEVDDTAFSSFMEAHDVFNVSLCLFASIPCLKMCHWI